MKSYIIKLAVEIKYKIRKADINTNCKSLLSLQLKVAYNLKDFYILMDLLQTLSLPNHNPTRHLLPATEQPQTGAIFLCFLLQNIMYATHK